MLMIHRLALCPAKGWFIERPPSYTQPLAKGQRSRKPQRGDPFKAQDEGTLQA